MSITLLMAGLSSPLDLSVSLRGRTGACSYAGVLDPGVRPCTGYLEHLFDGFL